jgi:putative heme transporter
VRRSTAVTIWEVVPTSPQRGRGRSLLVRAVLLAALLVAVAAAIAGLVPGSGHRLAHAAPGWIAAAIASELVALAAYAVLFHGVFSYGAYGLGFIRAAQIGLGELGAFVVLPTGAGGPALRIWALMRGGMPFGVVITRSVVHAAVFNIPYLLVALALGTSVVFGLGPGHAPVAVALAPLAVIAVTLVFVVGAVTLARARPTAPPVRWRRIGWQVIQAVPAGIRELPSRVRHPSLLLSATGYWVGDCGVLILSFHAAHGSAPVGVIVLAYMLGQLGNALPLPGGVGGTEPIMLGVLTASGVNLALGAAAVVIYRVISLGLQALAGGVAAASLLRTLPPRDAAQWPSVSAPTSEDARESLGPAR